MNYLHSNLNTLLMENIMNNAIQQWGPLTGRILISLIFLMSGFGKVFQFDGQVAYAASQGVPLASLAIIISIIAELAAATMIIIGYRARLGALILLVWMIPVSIMLHAFWNIEDPMAQQMHMIMFMKNLAMAGGFLALANAGAGAISLDARRGILTPVAA